MDVLLNDFKASKSSSLVMMQSAFHDTASSRYISSFGSRQIRSRFMISTLVQSDLNSFRKSILISFVRYLSNFFRIKTSINSAYTWLDNSISEEEDFPFSRALVGTESFIKSALIKTLPSKISRIYSSLRSSSSSSGVKPFFLACSPASSIISSRLFFCDSKRLKASETAFLFLNVLKVYESD